jgi:hypothetical protein
MSPKFCPSWLLTLSRRDSLAPKNELFSDCLLNLWLGANWSWLAGVVGETMEATLMPPEVGELSGCAMFVVMGDGVLSLVEEWYPEEGGVLIMGPILD